MATSFQPIGLQVKVPEQGPDMLQRAGRILSLQEGLALKREREAQARKLEQDQRERSVLMDAYGKYGNDITKIRAATAGQVAPDKVESLAQTMAETAEKYLKMGAAEQAQWDKKVAGAAAVLADLPDMPEDKAKEVYNQRLGSAIATGTATPQELAQLGLTPDNYNREHVRSIVGYSLGTEKVLSNARADAEAKRKAVGEELTDQLKLTEDYRKQQEHDAKLGGEQAKGEQEELQLASTKLGAVRTEAEYLKARGNLPYRIASQFPDKWDAKTTPQQVRDLGMTPKDQATEAKPPKEEAPTFERDLERVAISELPGATPEQVQDGKIASRKLELRKANRAPGRGTGQANQNRQMTRVDKLQDDEDKVRSERARLEAAITAGNVYVDRIGNIKDFTDAKSDAEKGSWLADMNSRYSELTNKLRNVTREKNQIGKQLGAQISVSTEEIHANLDRDLTRVQWIAEKNQAKATGTPTANVMIELPNGAAGLISRAKLDDAIKRGAKVVDDGGIRVK